MRRVEKAKDLDGGWIARRADGTIYPDRDFRWNSRASARDAARQADLYPDT